MRIHMNRKRIQGDGHTMQETASENASRFPGGPDLSSFQSEDGESWDAFRKQLKPNYFAVWREIALAYAMLIIGFGGICFLNLYYGQLIAFLFAPFVAIWLGFWLLALGGFVHEAAHFNLAADKKLNDWLARLFVFPLFPLDIKAFRRSHWRHHTNLGDPHDTEISYHHQPTLGLVLQSATGIYSIRVLLRYFRFNRDKGKSNGASQGASSNSSNRYGLRQNRRYF